jgi:hypothetical protein
MTVLTKALDETEVESTSIRQWPAPPDDAAYDGLVGEVVRLIEPCSEADPAGILLQTIVMLGNAIGHSPHFWTDGARQYMSMSVVFVGPSGSGRKGTIRAQGHNLMKNVDPDWLRDCTSSGLSSGEGLIYRLRDASDNDPGVTEKRLLVTESEFASVLKMTKREGNVLSMIIRQAFDGDVLQTMTKNSPNRATDTHVSIIGHITSEELTRTLDRTDVSNGFLNRMMMCAVKRSRYLPNGGRPDPTKLLMLGGRILNAVQFARGVGEMTRDPDAERLWCDEYAGLSDRPGGLLGKATGRATAYVVRLSCLYALLDHSATIRHEHLQSALAVWRYIEDSTAFFLGDTIGDPIADKILLGLLNCPDGLSRTEISALGGRNWPSVDIDRALSMLTKDGLAAFVTVPTPGRPTERWFASRHVPVVKVVA